MERIINGTIGYQRHKKKGRGIGGYAHRGTVQNHDQEIISIGQGKNKTV